MTLDNELGLKFRAPRYLKPVVRFSLHITRVEGVCIDEFDGLSGWRLLRLSKEEQCAYATAHEAFSAIWKTATAGNNNNLAGGD